MLKETMSPSERWLAVLNRESPDRVPMDIWITPEARDKLLAYLGCDWDAALERLHIDTPLTVGGRYVGPPPQEGEDIWRIRHRSIDYGTGAYDEAVSAPLAQYDCVEAIEANSVRLFDFGNVLHDRQGNVGQARTPQGP